MMALTFGIKFANSVMGAHGVSKSHTKQYYKNRGAELAHQQLYYIGKLLYTYMITIISCFR